MRKLFYPYLFTSILVLFSSYQVKASHIYGGEITYACTATPGLFEITFVLYRDCTGGELCSGTCVSSCALALSIMGGDPGYTNTSFGSVVLPLQNVRDVGKNTSLCPSVKNMCTNHGCVSPGTFTPAAERYEFKGFANIGSSSGIPSACCTVRFTYGAFSVAGTTTGGFGSSVSNYYTEATVNRCLSISPCNSSPVFTNDPLFLAVGGESVIYNNGLQDQDGDSLSISFAPLLTAYNTPGFYVPPFSFDKPMPWTGDANGAFPAGISCNGNTGDVMFTPGNSGSTFNGFVGFACQQWKKINGVYQLLGVVRRDCIMTLTSGYVSNPVPDIRTNPLDPTQPNQPKTKWVASAGKQLCFTVFARDTNSIYGSIQDTTFLSWNGALSRLGATFTPTYDSANRFKPAPLGGPREDQYQFCWTPHDSVANGSTYYFNVLSTDNRCPIRGKASRSFGIQVLQQPSLTIQPYTSACAQKQFSISNNSPFSRLDSVVWRVTRKRHDTVALYVSRNAITPLYSFNDSGTYYIHLLAYSQPEVQTVVVDSFTAAPFTLTDSVYGITTPTCYNGDNGRFSVTGLGGASPYTYSLNALTFQSSPHFTRLPAGIYTVTIKDAANCSLSTTVAIPAAPVFAANYTLTEPSCYQANNGSIRVSLNNGTAPFQYKLNNQPFQSLFVFSQVAAGTHVVTIKDQNNCVITDSIELHQPQALSFTYTSVKPFCRQTPEGSISMNAYGGVPPYSFKLNATTFQPVGVFDHLVAGNYVLSVMDSNGCTFAMNMTLHAVSSLQASTTHAAPTCFARNDGSINVTAMGGSTPFLYQLDNGTFAASGLFTQVSSGRHEIAVKDGVGCMVTLTDSLPSPARIQAGSITGDSMTSRGNTYPYEVPMQPGLTYAWSVRNGTIVSGRQTNRVVVRWDTTGIGTIKAVALTDSLCGDTTSMEVHIGSTGTNELHAWSAPGIYPNPATTWADILVHTEPQHPLLSLYDIQGKLLLEHDLRRSHRLNIQDLPPGVYILTIDDWHLKMIKN